ncbi:thioesterase family protein [Staphylococcus borealis]|uniref:thioesterase family protein n=1 Tax=Staphylococcus borealis TaxID=2742203 RepID=UPI000FF16CEC|nr:thioesterase family protein [Staphylococcus borealis]MDM7863165.1 thioesterase family protein [Staphylococcus borealis]RIO92696.1 thioesterase [Staphylococcus haemolyticus]
MSNPLVINNVVHASQIDHNNHMHDSEYNKTFSAAVNEFNYTHGLSLEEREILHYTMFTLEEHTTYLVELSLDSTYRIEVYIYDYDYKRVHFFLMLYNNKDELAATNEVIMMGIDTNKRKSAPFPTDYHQNIARYYQQQGTIDWPKQLGHQIGIPKKEN